MVKFQLNGDLSKLACDGLRDLSDSGRAGVRAWVTLGSIALGRPEGVSLQNVADAIASVANEFGHPQTISVQHLSKAAKVAKYLTAVHDDIIVGSFGVRRLYEAALAIEQGVLAEPVRHEPASITALIGWLQSDARPERQRASRKPKGGAPAPAPAPAPEPAPAPAPEAPAPESDPRLVEILEILTSAAEQVGSDDLIDVLKRAVAALIVAS